MQNKTLIAAGRKILKELLPQCTEGEQKFFKRIYCQDFPEFTIDEVIDQLDPNWIDRAITQVETTLEKRNGTERSHSQTS